MDNDGLPQTAMAWDKLLLANPQNSMLWMRYMAFHLHSTEIENARTVGQRALKSIDLRFVSDFHRNLNCSILFPVKSRRG